ncbi:unnamed protein product, partial [Prorocentrum cordatum]
PFWLEPFWLRTFLAGRTSLPGTGGGPDAATGQRQRRISFGLWLEERGDRFAHAAGRLWHSLEGFFCSSTVGLLQDPPKQFALRESACAKESENVFTVTKLLDGKVLQKLGKGSVSGQDEESVVKYVADPPRGVSRRRPTARAGSSATGIGASCTGTGSASSGGARRPARARAARPRPSTSRASWPPSSSGPGRTAAGRRRRWPQTPPPRAARGGRAPCPAYWTPLGDKFLDFETLWGGCVEECKAGAEVQATSAEEFTCAFVKETPRRSR